MSGLVLDHSPIVSNSFPQSGLRCCKNRLANVLLCHSFLSTLACSEYTAVIVTCACKMTISIQFQFSNLAQIYNAEFHMFKFLKVNYNCQVGKHLINSGIIFSKYAICKTAKISFLISDKYRIWLILAIPMFFSW